MSGKKKILIVDDHPLIREGIKSTIERTRAYEVVGEAGKFGEALGMALELRPDIILLDISLPDGNGTQLIRQIRTVLPKVIFLMVSLHRSTNHVADAFQAGATGYYVKGSPPETLVEALDVVSQGGYFFEHPLSAEAFEQLKNLVQDGPKDGASRYQSLTKRQQEVMELLVQGLSYKTIGERLDISEITVSHHRSQIMTRLGIKSRAELLRLAAALGLITPEA